MSAIISPDGLRCFFSSYGGAPLGAQISLFVIFSLTTICGFVIGIGGVVESRRGWWWHLAYGIGGYGFFIWWSSPC